MFYPYVERQDFEEAEILRAVAFLKRTQTPYFRDVCWYTQSYFLGIKIFHTKQNETPMFHKRSQM